MIDNQTSINYRIINLGGSMLYVEGIRSVVSFGANELQFQLKNHLLIVEGNNLSIKQLDKTTCSISGEICSVVVK